MNTQRALSAIVVTAVAIALAGCAAGGGGGETDGDNALGLVKPGTLTICANLETPPNIYAEADGTPVGVEVEIAKDDGEGDGAGSCLRALQLLGPDPCPPGQAVRHDHLVAVHQARAGGGRELRAVPHLGFEGGGVEGQPRWHHRL